MIVTINDAREAVYQHFVAGWAAALALWQPRMGLPVATVPYALGDETITPPASVWVRLTVRHLTSFQETLGRPGNRKFGRPAIAFVQGFAPPTGDTRPLEAAMEAARTVFEARSVGTVALRFNAATIRELGVIEQGRWEAMTTECPLEYEDIR